MTVRDTRNTIEGYKEIQAFNEEAIDECYEEIDELRLDETNEVQKYPKPNKEIIASTYKAVFDYQYKNLILSYSLGEDTEKVRKEYVKTVKMIAGVWKMSSGYVQMLTLVSLGILLEVENEVFFDLQKLVEESEEQDALLNYMIGFRENKKVPGSKVLWDKPYKKLIPLIAEEGELSDAEKVDILAEYLQKHWYRNFDGKDTHNTKWNIHIGYWSFESGALVKILGLDDTKLKDLSYYPYDLVHK